MGQLDGRIMARVATTMSISPALTVVSLRPPGVGIQWEIIWAIGRQDDGAVLNGWWWTDPGYPAGAQLYMVTRAANVPLPLGALDFDLPNVSMGPWWATWDRYPSYAFLASAAGKTGTVIAIVVEHVGVEGLE